MAVLRWVKALVSSADFDTEVESADGAQPVPLYGEYTEGAVYDVYGQAYDPDYAQFMLLLSDDNDVLCTEPAGYFGLAERPAGEDADGAEVQRTA